MSVTIVVGKRHLLAGLSLLVLTALIGVALVVPAISDASTTYHTRSASCPGLDFLPMNGTSDYESSDALRGGFNTQQTLFRCNADLPTGAIVTQVQFTLVISYPGSDPITCLLTRNSLAATANSGSYQAMAGPLTLTPVSTDNNTTYRLSDSTITDPTVDDANYAYFLECSMGKDIAPGDGILGADVIYKISTANG